MIDIHPEDLLDREREGSLSPEEREYLDAHLERCATCRVERLLAFECAAERELIDTELAASGKRAKPHDRVPSTLDVPSEERKAPSRPPRSRTGMSTLKPARAAPKVAFVSAALLLAGGAAALGGGLPWVTTPRVVASANVSVSAPSEPAPPPPRPRARAGSPPVSASPPVDVPDAGSEGGVATTSGTPAPPPPVSAPVEASSARARPRALDAAGLFAAGAAARRNGDYDQALAFYDRLIESHPASPEAKTAQAVRARLLLDLGRTGAAEKGFRAAASEVGPLSEVALVGQAQALRQAGKLQAEAAVWRELLRRYPASAQAAVARARLRELGD